TLACRAVQANLAGCQDVFQSESNSHGRDRRRVTAGAVDTLHHDGIVTEHDHAGRRAPQLRHRNSVPSRNRRLVERHMAVIADAAVTDVDPAQFLDLVADLIDPERMGKEALIRWDAQLFMQMLKDLAPHVAFKAERMRN